MPIIIKIVDNNLQISYIAKKMIISPCISICKTDPLTGYCYGCGRSNEDKIKWKNLKTTDEWKKNNLKNLEKRLNGWQLDSFHESYKNKIKNRISVIKKKKNRLFL